MPVALDPARRVQAPRPGCSRAAAAIRSVPQSSRWPAARAPGGRTKPGSSATTARTTPPCVTIMASVSGTAASFVLRFTRERIGSHGAFDQIAFCPASFVGHLDAERAALLVAPDPHADATAAFWQRGERVPDRLLHRLAQLEPVGEQPVGARVEVVRIAGERVVDLVPSPPCL